jgi:hypothetical protein
VLAIRIEELALLALDTRPAPAQATVMIGLDGNLAISLLLLAGFVSLATVLLWKKKIKPTAYCFFFPMACLLAFLPSWIGRLREVQGPKFKLILEKVNQARSDVYAKADEVRNPGDQIAGTAISLVEMTPAWSEISTNGLISPNGGTPEKLVETRERIVGLLKAAGSSGDQVEKVTTRMTSCYKV